MENYLLKFFSEEQYINIFRNGTIRMMSAYYYVNFEEDNKKELYNNRFDATEGKSILINRENVEKPFNINFPDGSKWNIGVGVKRLLFNTSGSSGRFKISCFYALQKNDFPSGRFKEALDTMEDSLGEFYIIFLNPEEFVRRVQKRVNILKAENIVNGFGMDYVEYYDASRFSGIAHPFQKPDKLKWQHEYRMLVETNDVKDEFILDIEDIRDITMWGRVEDLYNGYVVDNKSIYIPNIQSK